MNKTNSMMTPREIVEELNKHIIGQDSAKRAVAIALRNRWRRMQINDEALREEGQRLERSQVRDNREGAPAERHEGAGVRVCVCLCRVCTRVHVCVPPERARTTRGLACRHAC